MQNFEDNTTVIVTRGSKSAPKGAEVTVLGYDAIADAYAVRLPATGTIVTLKASALSAKPERTFTESQVREALDAVRARNDFDMRNGAEVLDVFDATLFDA